MSFILPVKGTLTQGFGGNAPYYKQFGQLGHNGIDLGAPYDTPVYAADDGTVAYEGWGDYHTWMGSPAGICVLIHHGGSYAGYAHLNQTVVNQGEQVSKGQLIGYVGATGAATGPHLHFEMLPLVPNFNNGYAGRIDVTQYIETSNNASVDEVKAAYLEILERPADADGIAHYTNYPLSFVRDDLAKSDEKRQLEASKAAAALAEAQRREAEAKKIADAKLAAEAAAKAQAELDRIAAEKAAADKLAEDQARDKAAQYEQIAKENNTILKRIEALVIKLVAMFTNVFNTKG